MSKRAKDKLIREGVKALRRKPGWDPSALETKSPLEQLRDLEQAEATTDSYDDAAKCEACEAERLRTSDDTALCEKHLAEAMGLRP